MKQSANGTADTLGSLKESLSNIAQNARVTQWLAQEEKTAYAEAGWTQDTGDSMDGYVDGLVQDEIYKNYKRGNIFRIYIYDLQGLRYSSDRPVVTWETAVDYIKKAAPVGEDMPDYVLLDGPVRSDEGGLYRHGFYLIEPVKDLLSEQVEGYVLMHFSEKVLYDSYSDMRGKDRKFCIVSNSGTLVSGENKSEIGGMAGCWGTDDGSWTGIKAGAGPWAVPDGPWAVPDNRPGARSGTGKAAGRRPGSGFGHIRLHPRGRIPDRGRPGTGLYVFL